MVKQQSPKKNPLLDKNIPQAPAISADQPIAKEETDTVQSSIFTRNSNTVSDGTLPQHTQTAKQQNTVKQQSRKREKITFYLEPEQASKLYDFMEAFRKRTGVKINQQDMLRRIIDVMTIDTVLP